MYIALVWNSQGKVICCDYIYKYILSEYLHLDGPCGYNNVNMLEIDPPPNILCHELLQLVSQTSSNPNLIFDSSFSLSHHHLQLVTKVSQFIKRFHLHPHSHCPTGLLQQFLATPVCSVFCFQNNLPKIYIRSY